MRPNNWLEYFLGLAKVISKKSHDIETQHGTVIADNNNIVVGIGFNGFPRGMNDDSLPNTRPEKYNFILHSEVNAILNCNRRPENCTAFVTGECCNPCLHQLWQAGIKKVFHLNTHGSHLIDGKMRSNRKIFLEQTGMIVTAIDINLDWLNNL